MIKLIIFIVYLLCVFGVEIPFNYGYNNVCKKITQNLHNKPTALILARGGSKGIKLKNIEKINGTTLLGRAINTIKSTNLFNDIWISTDHDLIAKEAEKYENVHIHLRSEQTLDTTSSIESVQEFIKYHDVEKIALIQCTSIFLKEKYLFLASQKFEMADCDCVFSIIRDYKLRWKFNNKTNRLTALNFDPAKRPRRQDWNGEMVEAGMFYFANRHLIEKGIFQNDKCEIVEIEQEDSLEIDNPIDLIWAQYLLENLLK